MSQLAELISEKQGNEQLAGSLIVFADDWGRHPSSCQHLIKRIRSRYKVLWVNTIGTRSPKANAFTLFRGMEKIRNWTSPLKKVSENMWVLDCPMLPWIGNRTARMINRRFVTRLIKKAIKRGGMESPVVISTLPHVSWLLGDVGEAGLIYYCTDDYSHWPEADRDSLLEAEKELQERSDLVLAVSDRLMERNQGFHSRFFPHAVDYDHFASAACVAPADELSQYKQPRIGFFGLIYEKLNFQMLKRIAVENQEVSLLMMGPIDYCPEEFSRLPNVHLTGKLPYEELPRWLAGLDLLLMPYVRDEMILQSSPLKLKECLATGIPTICVDIPEARKYESYLSVAESEDHFTELVTKQLSEPESKDLRGERQESIKRDTWDHRADELDSILRSEFFERF